MILSNAADTLEDVFVNSRLVSYQTSLEYNLAKVTRVFDYRGLDLTLPRNVLESHLTQLGSAVVYEKDGDLFVAPPDLSGQDEDLYGRPTRARVDHLGERLDLRLGVDAVLVLSDSSSKGLVPMLTELALMEGQIKITLNRALINLRTNYIMEARDENTRRGVEEFERQLRAGDLAVLFSDSPMPEIEGASVHNTASPQGTADQIVAVSQYIVAKYYGELGININNNMKSQYVNQEEIASSTGLPLLYDMLECRKEAVRDINALFGREIEVAVSDMWDDEIKEKSDDELGLGEEAPADGEPGEGAPDGPAADEPDGGSTGGDEAEEPAEEADEPLEEATREEVIEAAEALQGEEVEDNDEADEDTDPDDGGSAGDPGQDD